ncbi:MAG: hypothetical protein P8Y48_00450 [Novosphingobium sp.]
MTEARFDVDCVDLFHQPPDTKFKSTSKVLLSGGVQIEPMAGLNLFGGYAENFKALTDAVLEFGTVQKLQQFSRFDQDLRCFPGCRMFSVPAICCDA